MEQILFKRGQMQCAFVKKGGTAEEICFRPLHLCKGGKLFYLKKYHKGGKQHLKNIVISADGHRKVYAVPNIVAEQLEKYCTEFVIWLETSPHAKK